MTQQELKQRAEAAGYILETLDDGEGFNVRGFAGSDEPERDRLMPARDLLELVELQEAGSEEGQ